MTSLSRQNSGPSLEKGCRVLREHLVEHEDVDSFFDNNKRLSTAMLAEWMEKACLDCAVEHNNSGEAVWDAICGAGFSLNIKHLKPVYTGVSLIIEAIAEDLSSRQINFTVKAYDKDFPDNVFATGVHLRAYLPYNELASKVQTKQKQRIVRQGLRGVKACMVEKKHTGGFTGEVDPDGAIGNTVGTSSVIQFIMDAVQSSVTGFLQPDKILVPEQCSITHLAPTPIGFVVTCEAVLQSIEDSRLTFHVAAEDPFEKVAVGHYICYIADRQQFEANEALLSVDNDLSYLGPSLVASPKNTPVHTFDDATIPGPADEDVLLLE